jgi:hypothetical protein
LDFVRADIKQFCQVLVHLLDSNILGITEFSHQSVNFLMSLSVLRFALTFFISVVSVCCILPHLSCLLACHYDVIDAGHNNRLFAPGTDMNRALLRLSHIQKDTFYVQICDKYRLLHGIFHIIPFISHRSWYQPESQ